MIRRHRGSAREVVHSSIRRWQKVTVREYGQVILSYCLELAGSRSVANRWTDARLEEFFVVAYLVFSRAIFISCVRFKVLFINFVP